VTVSGIGERAGNVPLEDLTLALLTMYDQDMGLKTRKFFELSSLVRELARVEIPSNRPIVGPTLFQVESGIIADWVRNVGYEHALELSPYRPELVGQKPVEIVLGKNSGIPSVVEYLERIGRPGATREQILQMVAKVKERAHEKKELLTEEEFEEIATQVLG